MPVSNEGIRTPVAWGQAMDRVLAVAAMTEDIVFIGGGARVYAETMAFADELILSRIHGHYLCDAFYPPLPQAMQLVETQAMDGFDVYRYVRQRNAGAFG